jgi:hypothetical protein
LLPILPILPFVIDLGDAWSLRIAVQLQREIVAAVPKRYQALPAVRELRDLLMLPP